MLREAFSYDPASGLLVWKKFESKRRAGGPTEHGYRNVHFQKRPWREHRIIWKLVTGTDPRDDEIDHRNGQRDQNWWSNLRKATRSQQTINTPMNSRNTSGYRGVWKRQSGRWCAQISANGKTKVIGTFDTRKQAALAYQEKSRQLHGEFRRAL